MTFNLESISESKRAFRRRLARAPIAEKLRMLDTLRQRALSLRSTHAPPRISEQPARYRAH